MMNRNPGANYNQNVQAPTADHFWDVLAPQQRRNRERRKRNRQRRRQRKRDREQRDREQRENNE